MFATRLLASAALLCVALCPASAIGQESDASSGFDFGGGAPARTFADEVTVDVGGYLDFGFFAVTGNEGAGHVQDTSHEILPQYSAWGEWVFAGDPLSTGVNSRGEPADTGDASSRSRAIALDAVDSDGKPTFLVNEVNLDVLATFSAEAFAFVSVDLLPRQRFITDPQDVALGDFFEVDRAFLEVTPTSSPDFELMLQAGKFDSVMGREYRVQESPDRFGITPSLLFRYVGGHPLGLKARMKLLERALTIALAVTNGNHFVEMFPHTDEVDSNYAKTAAGRLSWAIDVAGGIEIGVSGLIGGQDGQDDDDALQWQIGLDVALDIWHLELMIEYQQGRMVGASEQGGLDCDAAQCLEFTAAYVQAIYRFTDWIGGLLRLDWREATHVNGRSSESTGGPFVYVAEPLRTTFGVRFDPAQWAIVKLEYVHNFELGRTPGLDNNVLTSSLVVPF